MRSPRRGGAGPGVSWWPRQSSPVRSPTAQRSWPARLAAAEPEPAVRLAMAGEGARALVDKATAGEAPEPPPSLPPPSSSPPLLLLSFSSSSGGAGVRVCGPAG